MKSTFRSLFEESVNGIAFGVWDHLVEFMCSHYIYPSKPDDVDAFATWLEGIEAWGGTDMRRALVEGISHFSDATDVYVLCDGEFEFADMQEFLSSESCRNRRFHMIAMEDEADIDKMKAMAHAR